MSGERSVEGMAHAGGVPDTLSLTIRDYESIDEERVLGLLRMALGERGAIPRTAAFWRWKHAENPFGVSRVLVAENGDLLGLRAFMRWVFNTPIGPVKAVRAVDTSTHPGYRRLGVFSRLTRQALDRVKAEGVNLVFNTPNAQSMAGYMKLGWTLLDRPRLLIRPLRPWRLLAAVLGRRRGLQPQDIPDFFRSPPRSVADLLRDEVLVDKLAAFDDGLCAEGIRTARSAAYLRWRYASIPSLPYFGHWLGKSPLTGGIVFRPNFRHGLRQIMICELLVGYGAAPQIRTLIGSLAAQVRADYLVAAAAPGTQHWGLLRRAGFYPLPQRVGPNFVVCPLDWPQHAPDPRRLRNWRLSLGDLEVL